ncbi:MAG: leucine-rich repeat domain-containing protein [Blautia sp.]|nr:leucine-rich repeat domain-containing protein [Blautia sp.]
MKKRMSGVSRWGAALAVIVVLFCVGSLVSAGEGGTRGISLFYDSDGVVKSTVQTHENIHFTADAPDADWIELLFLEGGRPADRRQGDGSHIVENWAWDHEGEVEVFAVAHLGEGEEEETWESGHCSFTITADGQLADPVISNVSGSIERGEVICGQFSAPGAGWCHITLHRDDGYEYVADMEIILDGQDQNIDFALNHNDAQNVRYFHTAEGINMANLDPGFYILEIHSHRFGKNSGHARKGIFVRDQPDTAATLYVGQTRDSYSDEDSQEVLSGQDFWLKVEAPDVTAVRINNHGRWDYFLQENGRDPSLVEVRWNFDRGNYTLIAQVSTEEYNPQNEGFRSEDLTWYGFSNAVNLSVTSPNGGLDEPDCGLVSDTVERGEFLQIWVNEQEDLEEWYWADVCVHRSNDEGEEWEDWINHTDWEGENLMVSTLNLEPGEYSVSVGVHAVGYDGNEKVFPFTVTEGALEITAQVSLSLNENGAAVTQTARGFQIYVYAPGADGVEAYITQEGVPEEEWNDSRGDGGEYSHWYWQFGHTGVYYITPVGYFGDDENAEDFRRTGEPVRVEVTAAGYLTEAGIHIPPVINIEDGLDGYFDPCAAHDWEGNLIGENCADGYNVNLNFIDKYGNWRHVYDYNVEPFQELSIHFDRSVFEEYGTGTYRVGVHAGGYNLDDSGSGCRVVVTDHQDAQQVRLTVNGSTEDDIEVQAFENLFVEVEAPGATAIRFYDDNWDYWYPDENGYDSRDREYWPGVYSLAAQATTQEFDEDAEGFRWEDLDWSVTSNGIRVWVTNPNGWLEGAGFTLAEAGQTVTRGEDWLHIHIDPVENAEKYDVWLDRFDENWNYAGFCLGETYWGAGDYLLPTSSLENGAHYGIHLEAKAVGYQASSADYQYFDVAEPEGDAIRFLAEKDQVNTGEAFLISIYAPGADAVRLCHEYEDNVWREDWADCFRDTFSINSSGSYRLRAFATYDDGENWGEAEYDICVEVNAPSGDLDEPDVEVADKFYLGDDITIHFNEVPNARYYSYWIHTSENDEFIHGNTREDQGDLILSTNALWGSGTYWLELDVNAPGYNEGHITRHFAVLDPADTEVENNYSEEFGGMYLTYGSGDVDTFTDVRLIAYAPGAWAGIRLYDIGDEDPEEIDWENYARTERDGPGVDVWASWRYAGDHQFYVMANYGDETGWSQPFYMCTIHVHAGSGDLDRPVVQMQDRALLGEDVTIHFEEVENGANYSYWIHKPDEDEFVKGDSRDGAGDLTFNTGDLWGSGVYWVELDVNNPGYNEGHTTLHLAVLDENDVEILPEDDSVYFTVGTLEVDTFTEDHIIAYLPGAGDGIRLYDIDDEDPEEIDWEDYARSEHSGPGLDVWGNWGYPGAHKFYVSGCYGGEWSVPRYMCTIQVNGSLEVLADADLYLPRDLTDIEEEAFAGLSVRLIRLAGDVERIQDHAFAGCTSLEQIYIPESTTEIAGNAFEGCNLLTIVGHSGSYAQEYAESAGIPFIAVGNN